MFPGFRLSAIVRSVITSAQGAQGCREGQLSGRYFTNNISDRFPAVDGKREIPRVLWFHQRVWNQSPSDDI